jgi:pimeloyl-ACP methyl ester carboxylesterase
MTRNLLIGIAAVGVISATTTVSALASTAHARTTTAVQASLNYCSHQTGGQRKTAPAFQQCMATRGYQLASTLRAATAAARQRVVIQPAAASGVAWRSKPSWYIVATEDRTVQPELQRFVAKRMGATTVELGSSHVPMLSQPQAVLDVIRNAAKAIQKSKAA